MENKLSKSLAKINQLPSFLKLPATNFVIGLNVPFIKTAGIQFLKTSNSEWSAKLKNRRKVRNHLNQVHAGAMVLLAETVAVFNVALNLPHDRLPLVKKIEADFVKRSLGSLKATCSLSAEQILLLETAEKGELLMDVLLTDESGEQPVLIKVTAAWILKKSR